MAGETHPWPEYGRGSKVFLRSLHEGDLDAVRRWDDDEEIVLWAGKKFETPLESATWLRDTMEHRGRWALAVMTTGGQLIGQIELDNITWRNGSAELKVCIGEKSFWDQGYGTDAVRTFLDYVLAHSNIQYIYLRVKSDNLRAIRCYEKCGFRKEGILRAGRRQRRGFHDLVLMGLVCRSRRQPRHA
ncbi:MAG: GNAT family protein [Bacillota bacterium]